MRTVDIVMTVIERDGSFILQLREFKASAGAGGLVGCFGGKIEPGEAPADAAARELGEETDLLVSPKQLRRLGNVEVESDMAGEPVIVRAQIFSFSTPPGLSITAREGGLVEYPRSQAVEHLDKMTPATKETFIKYILKEA